MEIDLGDGVGLFLIKIDDGLGDAGLVLAPVGLSGNDQFSGFHLGVSLVEAYDKGYDVGSDLLLSSNWSLNLRKPNSNRLIQKYNICLLDPAIINGVDMKIISFLKHSQRPVLHEQARHGRCSWAAVDPDDQRPFFRDIFFGGSEEPVEEGSLFFGFSDVDEASEHAGGDSGSEVGEDAHSVRPGVRTV